RLVLSRTAACLAVNPFSGCLKSDRLGLRLCRNALVEGHEDTGILLGVLARLPDLDHRGRSRANCVPGDADLPAAMLIFGLGRHRRQSSRGRGSALPPSVQTQAPLLDGLL